jgi:hypothetical protein
LSPFSLSPFGSEAALFSSSGTTHRYITITETRYPVCVVLGFSRVESVPFDVKLGFCFYSRSVLLA